MGRLQTVELTYGDLWAIAQGLPQIEAQKFAPSISIGLALIRKRIAPYTEEYNELIRTSSDANGQIPAEVLREILDTKIQLSGIPVLPVDKLMGDGDKWTGDPLTPIQISILLPFMDQDELERIVGA